MPIVGRNRKAKPRDVLEAVPQAPQSPKPLPSESFKDFLKRLMDKKCDDPLLVFLMACGADETDEPNQRDYILRLEGEFSRFYNLLKTLCGKWPKS